MRIPSYSIRGLGGCVLAIATLVSAVAPASAAGIDHTVEPGVLIWFVPLCALLFAIIVEAVRLVLRHDPPSKHPSGPVRRIPALSNAERS
jgi:hypothetical protein